MDAADEQVPVCVIAGAGPGNGAAFARRFKQAGYRVALLARDESRLAALAADVGDAQAFACDVTDAASVTRALGAVREQLGRTHTDHRAGALLSHRGRPRPVASLAAATRHSGTVIRAGELSPHAGRSFARRARRRGALDA